MTKENSFSERVGNRTVIIGVVGLGYVGLPTAISFFEKGFTVYGIDNDESVISKLRNGQNPINDPWFDKKTPDHHNERWNVTNSFSEAIPICDVIIVTVPTPVSESKQLDDSKVLEAGRDVFRFVPRGSGSIVVLESTVYPGFTSKIWTPIIEENGLRIGVDVHMAYCPERHNPGDSINNLASTSRVIGSENVTIGQNLVTLYSSISTGEVHFVGGMEIAESAKLIENVQRDINIALVNELSMILPKLDVDIEDFLDAASTKWNFHRYTPGIGVGGHCIPVDPYFLIDQASEKNSVLNLISSARAINDNMPRYISEQISSILQKHELDIQDSKILILGWSYKPGIGDTRGSPSRELAEILGSLGAKVSAWDPKVPESEFSEIVDFIRNIDEMNGYDLAIIATAHQEVLDLDWGDLSIRMRNCIIFDGRRCIDLGKMSDHGWSVYAIGAPF